MDAQLAGGDIGSVGKWSVAFVGGKMMLTGGVVEPIGEVSLSISIGAKQVIDALAAAIGGALPAEIAKIIEAGLGL